jgi:hypothetical protein
MESKPQQPGDKGASQAMNSSKRLPAFPDPKPDIHRQNDLLFYRVGREPRMAKASLSRLLKHFGDKKDFVILTSYQEEKLEQENIKTFEEFPRQYHALVGTTEIGAFELVRHWQEKGKPEELERSWFIVNGHPNLNGTPNLATEDFVAAAKALASQYNQTALIISRHGVTTLENPQGELIGTLATPGAIENAMHKLTQARSEFQEGDRPGYGYAELKHLKDKGRDSRFVLDRIPGDAGDEVPKQEGGPEEEAGKTASIPLCIFVGMAANNMERWVWSN